MTACVDIKFGTLILIISSIYIPLGKVDATETVSYDMIWKSRRLTGWTGYCSRPLLYISCSTGQHILILNAYIESGPNRLNLSDVTSSNSIVACNCKRRCWFKCIKTGYKLGDSKTTLHVKYQCKNDDCSDGIGSTTSTSPDTSTTHMLSSVRTDATSSSSPSSTSQLPLSTTRTTESDTTSSEQSSSSGNHRTTTSLLETTNVTRSTSYNTTVHATNEPQFDLYSGKDEKNTDKVIIAVCMSVIGLVGCILAVIFYRRWRKKKTIDYVYNNTTTEDADTGFTNLTYSETASKDDVKHDDTQSHSADSGYTDMRADETLDDTNDYYYSIKDGKEETLQPENDDYYAIKDNASQEYNKITFRPKSIPEDPSYVHTLRATNNKDRTYDHVDGEECIKSELPNDDYSQLKQYKDRSFNNIRRSPIGEAFKEDGTVVEPYENGAVHKYFTLEMNKYLRQTEADKENNLSHGYFVLEKEIPAQTNFPDGNVMNKKHVKINTAVAVQENDSSASSADHVYFENCRQADAESDSHQYQALEPHTSDPMEKSVENVNHDYFVLDKETNAMDTDKETDTSHDYFVLEEEILA